MPYTKQQYTGSIREALRIIGIKADQIEDDESDVIEIGRSWMIEFNPLTINLQQIIYIPGTMYRNNGDPGDPPDYDYQDVASISRDAHPDAVAEYFVTQIAHILIQEQLMAYGEAQFEEEMKNSARYDHHPESSTSPQYQNPREQEIEVDDVCFCHVMAGTCRIHPKIGG